LGYGNAKNEDENNNKDGEGSEYEKDGDEGDSKEEENEENRNGTEYRQAPKRPSAKHHEMIMANKIHRELVGPNSNL
jgi:hypothetical protein